MRTGVDLRIHGGTIGSDYYVCSRSDPGMAGGGVGGIVVSLLTSGTILHLWFQCLE